MLLLYKLYIYHLSLYSLSVNATEMRIGNMLKYFILDNIPV